MIDIELHQFHIKTNRETAIEPRSKTQHWCNKCDANIVSAGEKCGNCGNKPEKYKLKKETNAR